jgi:hypothetical protein
MRQFDEDRLRLGLPEDFSAAQLRRAYHSAIRRWHPDRNHNTKASARLTREIIEAFSRLSSDAADAGTSSPPPREGTRSSRPKPPPVPRQALAGSRPQVSHLTNVNPSDDLLATLNQAAFVVLTVTAFLQSYFLLTRL